MKHILWFLMVCGVAGGAQWYYPGKFQPQIDSLQAQVDKSALESKEAHVAVDQAGRDKAALAIQIEASKAQYEGKLKEASMQVADLTKKLQDAKTGQTAPAPVVAQVDTTPAEPSIELPDGSVVTVREYRAAHGGQGSPEAMQQTQTASNGNPNADRISVLQQDIADATIQLNQAEADLKNWDINAYVAQDGSLQGTNSRAKHRGTTDAPGIINASRDRIAQDQAMIQKLSGN